jgi:hypothetical protein
VNLNYVVFDFIDLFYIVFWLKRKACQSTGNLPFLKQPNTNSPGLIALAVPEKELREYSPATAV